jgi:hypothetical protein
MALRASAGKKVVYILPEGNSEKMNSLFCWQSLSASQ